MLIHLFKRGPVGWQNPAFTLFTLLLRSDINTYLCIYVYCIMYINSYIRINIQQSEHHEKLEQYIEGGTHLEA